MTYDKISLYKEDVMNISEQIKRYRMEKGLTQLKLAKKTGLTPAAISQYESETRKPTVEAIKKIAEVLEVSVDVMIGSEALPSDEQKKDIEKFAMYRKMKGLSDEDQKKVDEYMDLLAMAKNKKEDL
jgi:transcriptional regulator with XRE-family HTH domain